MRASAFGARGARCRSLAVSKYSDIAQKLLDAYAQSQNYLGTGADPSQTFDAAKSYTQSLVSSAPGMGAAHAFGYTPNFGNNYAMPESFDKGASLKDNLNGGNYGQAAMQGVGLLGDVALLGGGIASRVPAAAQRGMASFYGLPGPFEGEIARRTGENTKKLASRLISGGQAEEGQRETIKLAIDSIKQKQAERRKLSGTSPFNKFKIKRDEIRWNNSPYILEKKRQAAIDKEIMEQYNSAASLNELSKTRSDAIKKYVSLGVDFLPDVQRELRSGATEAIAKNLAKLGWTARHKSTGSGGKITSRYIVSPDRSREVRISDHELPTRNLEEDISGRYKRGQDYVVTAQDAKTKTIKQMIDEILGVGEDD